LGDYLFAAIIDLAIQMTITDFLIYFSQPFLLSTVELATIYQNQTVMNQLIHLSPRGWRAIGRSLFLLLLSFTFSSVLQAQSFCQANVGRLGNLKVCQSATTASIQADQLAAPEVPTGYSVLYVLTKGDSLKIQGVSRFPFFKVQPNDLYTIHTLVYNPTTLDLSIVKPGITTGFDVNSLLIQGGGKICAALDVAGAKFNFGACTDPCFAKAGTLRPATRACLDGDTLRLRATVATAPVIPDSFQVAYVLTRGDSLVIINAGAKPEFVVNSVGKYTIHTLVYNPKSLNLAIVRLGVTTGFDVNKLLVQGGGSICAALDVAGAKFDVTACPCVASTGILRAVSGACLQDGKARLKAIQSSRPIVPNGYKLAYVLTRSDSLVIIGTSATPEFNVTRAARYTIHTLVYNPATLDLSIVKPGVTTGFDVNKLLVQGGGKICAALDVAGAKFDISATPCCTAKAGTLRPATRACLEGDTLRLRTTVATSPFIPDSFQVAYVLTRGDSLVIINAGAKPEFVVNRVGKYTIHTLVYNPKSLNLAIVRLGVTTGFDVNKLLVQGGGSICAALDVAGAKFDVTTCPCVAATGTLRAVSGACLQDGKARLQAIQSSRPIVPNDYKLAYVLTRSDSLVIIGTSATPDFTVTRAARYTIHTLVYNPATLDLGIVKPGITTGVDVNKLLIQGGGKICAALDVAGAKFDVSAVACCTAKAGTLRAFGSACLTNGNATLNAAISQLPTIPAGYRLLYVLTSGDKLVIEQVNSLPIFNVKKTGKFTIHTLVYNPTTLDLSIVKFGQTTGVDVNGLLVQGGGKICAALDVAGAPFNVVECACTVSVGRIAPQPINCYNGLRAVRLKASILHQPSGPSGYRSIWVLTEGDSLIIRAVNTHSPEFYVNRTGKFTIHTLIYNPATLDLSIVKLGKTTGFDVNGLLVQGGGSICAGLDVTGAAFEIKRCNSVTFGELQGSNVFPNPAQNALNVQLSNKNGAVSVEIVDLNGKLMQRHAFESGITQAELDVTNLSAGMYFVRINAEGQAGEMLKFTKQ
jgi:hypothetical protein